MELCTDRLSSQAVPKSVTSCANVGDKLSQNRLQAVPKSTTKKSVTSCPKVDYDVRNKKNPQERSPKNTWVLHSMAFFCFVNGGGRGARKS